MKTRRDSAMNAVGFTDTGYYRNYYSDPNWKDPTDIQDINDVKHPLCQSGIVDAKKFNAMQKAITYCILRNGGSCPGECILRFLNDHMDYINSDRQKPMEQKPDFRILHINIGVKKGGTVLFLPDPRNRDNYICNVPKGFKTEHQQDDIFDMHSGDATESQTDALDSEQNLPSEPKESPVREDGLNQIVRFHNLLLEIINECDSEMTLQEITEKAGSFMNTSGWFKDLSPEQRVRANLIVLKSRKLVRQCPSGNWARFDTRATNSSSYIPSQTTSNDLPRFLEGVNIANLTVSELYALVKSRVDC